MLVVKIFVFPIFSFINFLYILGSYPEHGFSGVTTQNQTFQVFNDWYSIQWWQALHNEPGQYAQSELLY